MAADARRSAGIAARSASRTEHIDGVKTSLTGNMKSVEFWPTRGPIDREHAIERVS